MRRVSVVSGFARASLACVLVLGPACEFDDVVEVPRDGSAGASTTSSSAASTTSSTPSTTSSATDTSATSSTSTGSGGSAGASTTSSGSAGDGGAGGATGTGGSGASGGRGGTSGGSAGDAGSAGSGQGGSGGADDAGAVTTVDDAVAGTGANQFNYVGTWKSCPNGTCNTVTVPELYMRTNHWAGGVEAGTTTDYVTFGFTGAQLLFYGVKDTHYGMGAVSVDGGTEATIDFYSATRAGDQLLWTSPVLASGTHTFKLRVTGTKNASSTDSTITVDRVDFR
jgi:hypothetical protein